MSPTMLLRCVVLVVLGVVAGAMWPGPARAETQNCTVLTTMPATLSAPGHYCLDQDFALFPGSNPMVTISADDVVLDCNGHTLRNTYVDGDGIGVSVVDVRRGVTVRQCVLDGFEPGVSVETYPGSTAASTAIRIEDNRILRAHTTGIRAIGSNLRIERNQVSQLRGGTASPLTAIRVEASRNLDVRGAGIVIRDNLIADVKPQEYWIKAGVYAIFVYGVSNTVISGNRISGFYVSSGTTMVAIRGNEVSNSLVSGNTILTPPPLPAPLDGTQYQGVLIEGASPASVICTDNTVGHFATNFVGCTQADNTAY
jgi:hypothetical protein